MKPKTLILMLVAVVCGLGASYMTSRLLAERDEKPADAPEIVKVTLLVAKKSIEMHKPLGEKPELYFTEKTFVKDDAPKDALTKDEIGKLKKKFLKRGFRPGDFVTADDLMDNTLSLKNLPVGKLAVGIRVNVEQIAGGFASLPGSHVDIVWTTRGNNDPFARVLLENVIVLAADTASNPNENGGAMPASVVTVALTMEEAMKVALATENGSLKLFLRNLDDKTSSDKERVTMTELMKGTFTRSGDAVAEVQPIVPVQPPKPDTKPEPIPDPKPEHKPLPQLKKQTVIVRNGADVLLRHYWVDDQDNIIANPQQYLEQFEMQELPEPAPNEKKSKKPVEKDA